MGTEASVPWKLHTHTACSDSSFMRLGTYLEKDNKTNNFSSC